nr:DUF6525 family protein [Shimia haliotis]
MSKNLQSSLRRRSRPGDTMRSYDALPADLRCWLRGAALPWSPASAKKIWLKAGGATTPQAALARLGAVESAMLKKDRSAMVLHPNA